MEGNIALHVHGLMVCHDQHNTLLWEESFRWLRNAAGPLDVPLNEKVKQITIRSLDILCKADICLDYHIKKNMAGYLIAFLWLKGSVIIYMTGEGVNPARSAMGVQCSFSVPAVGHCTWTACHPQCALQLHSLHCRHTVLLCSGSTAYSAHYNALYAHCTSSWITTLLAHR